MRRRAGSVQKRRHHGGGERLLSRGLRGNGIGRLLYDTLFGSLRHDDIHRIVAGVTLPNDASIALHRRCGFREVGRLSAVGRKFDRYWDVAWFERPLLIGQSD